MKIDGKRNEGRTAGRIRARTPSETIGGETKVSGLYPI